MKTRHVFAVIAAGLVVDLLSIIAWGNVGASAFLMCCILVVFGLCTLADLKYGVALVLAELVLGSQGRLFEFSMFGVSCSLRMAMFSILLVALCWKLLQLRHRSALGISMISTPLKWLALAFSISIVAAFIIGVFRNASGLVYTDGNAWLFLLLTPAFLLAAQEDTRLLTRSILYAGLYLIFRAFVLLFMFSHDLGGLWVAFYQWVRDTRLGEITVLPGGFPRVFLQSMVLLFPVGLLAAREVLQSSRLRTSAWQVVLFGGAVSVLVLSMSRSYWLAMLVLSAFGAAVVGVRLFRRRNVPWRRLFVLAGAGTSGLLLAICLVWLPWPRPLSTGVGDAIAQRLIADEAVGNRWQQIKPLTEAIWQHPLLGAGFGASVTYESKDPRTLAAFPDGQYTSTAFEWGYLDDLLERGIIGLGIEIVLLGLLIVMAIRKGGAAAALGCALLGIVVVHATSPYLNHPLGLTVLMLVFALLLTRRHPHKTVTI
ncbi:MAG: O-antigen ligase family protein [Candidatus Uhrbacteria bacterium]